MNINVLIDAIVRQTTVLIAQLATAGGARAPLAHTANQIIADMVRELKEQGLGNKVIADMFGLSLRTYHKKVARLAESGTDRGRSLWEALIGFVGDRGTASRAEVLRRFRNDDEAIVRGVLKDLVTSGLLFHSGRGDLTVYRLTTAEDVGGGGDESVRLAHVAWIAIYRYGPLTIAELSEHLPVDSSVLQATLRCLTEDGRVQANQRDTELVYSSRHCVLPPGDGAGWEAALFDHYQAMVTAICTKLRLGNTRARAGEWVGGSTYSYDVWPGHPHRDEVLGFLQETRDRAVALREKVRAHNERHTVDDESVERVIAYVGQTIVGFEDAEEASE